MTEQPVAPPDPAADPAPPAPSAPGADAPRPRGLTMFELARLEEARRQAAQVDSHVRDSATATAARAIRKPSGLMTAGAALVACSAVIALYPSVRTAIRGAQPTARFVHEAAGAEVVPGLAELPAASGAYGKSGSVKVRVAMPGQAVEYPLTLGGDPALVAYQWVRAGDSSAVERPRALGGSVIAPSRPGLYHLALGPRYGEGAAAEERRILGEITVAVLVPFGQKFGGQINGYRIGSYPFERLGGERPLGFIEVDARTAKLQLSRHLRLGDFITRDGQKQWPRYVAVSPRLLDKVELVIDEVARLGFRGDRDPLRVSVDVHSGFRTPLHNRGVEGSALNSRHQYGDAADVAIDVDGDGRFTSFDSRLVAIAVEMVEKRHPELSGGLGVYPNGRSPYVHIDARGKRARWWG